MSASAPAAGDSARAGFSGAAGLAAAASAIAAMLGDRMFPDEEAVGAPARRASPVRLPRPCRWTATRRPNEMPSLDFDLDLDTRIGRAASMREDAGDAAEAAASGDSDLSRAIDGRFELPSLDLEPGAMSTSTTRRRPHGRCVLQATSRWRWPISATSDRLAVARGSRRRLGDRRTSRRSAATWPTIDLAAAETALDAGRRVPRGGRKWPPSSTWPRPTRRSATRKARANCSRRCSRAATRRNSRRRERCCRRSLSRPGQVTWRKPRLPRFVVRAVRWPRESRSTLAYDGSRFNGWQTQPGGAAACRTRSSARWPRSPGTRSARSVPDAPMPACTRCARWCISIHGAERPADRPGCAASMRICPAGARGARRHPVARRLPRALRRRAAALPLPAASLAGPPSAARAARRLDLPAARSRRGCARRRRCCVGEHDFSSFRSAECQAALAGATARGDRLSRARRVRGVPVHRQCLPAPHDPQPRRRAGRSRRRRRHDPAWLAKLLVGRDRAPARGARSRPTGSTSTARQYDERFGVPLMGAAMPLDGFA